MTVITIPRPPREQLQPHPQHQQIEDHYQQHLSACSQQPLKLNSLRLWHHPELCYHRLPYHLRSVIPISGTRDPREGPTNTPPAPFSLVSSIFSERFDQRYSAHEWSAPGERHSVSHECLGIHVSPTGALATVILSSRPGNFRCFRGFFCIPVSIRVSKLIRAGHLRRTSLTYSSNMTVAASYAPVNAPNYTAASTSLAPTNVTCWAAPTVC
jgi:hypothetical protein